MIIFKIDLKHQQDLLEADASLSLGWLSITENGVEVAFFKKRLCMIFLTLGSLLEILAKLNQKSTKQTIKWVGDDNGETVLLTMKGKELHLSTGHLSVLVPYQEFKASILGTTKDFLAECVNSSKSIAEESAFKNLSMAYTELA